MSYSVRSINEIVSYFFFSIFFIRILFRFSFPVEVLHPRRGASFKVLCHTVHSKKKKMNENNLVLFCISFIWIIRFQEIRLKTSSFQEIKLKCFH